ncbi:MAG: cytochrome c oxidase subunit II [Betaproteobacteria bacterium]|jgi:cytochrome c oxidase subunit 2|nr:cytochrome c oxidase subunit II [Betaproteobacteria bacterium]MDH4293629.1 cytochrome c oxidase subunit II [Betaproteobacteria bacterium]MDH5343106.1 cytochrome c oxidase subunit II [Betaproteobacteria bacterium]
MGIKGIWKWAVAGALYFWSLAAWAEYKLNLQTPQTLLGEKIYDLHTIITVICFVIFIGVFGFMFYAVFKHRKSVGHKAAQFHENIVVEVAWTLIPAAILVAMAVPATGTLIAMRDTSEPDLTIKATGYQWKWGYDYLKGEGEGISFYSTLSTPRAQIDGRDVAGRNANPNYLLEVDNHVVVPVGKKVRVLTTAADVLHAWYVPALAVKQDAVPGFIRDTWFKAEKAGIYRGQCAELCGKDHGFMPIVVEVMEQAQYTAWASAQQKKVAAAKVDPNKTWTPEELKAHGEKVYAQNCVACHQATGMGVPGAFPALSGSKVVNGPAADQIKLVLNGKQGTAMNAFKHLSDADLAGVITYTRNSWNNKVGDATTPADIKAARN